MNHKSQLSLALTIDVQGRAGGGWIVVADRFVVIGDNSQGMELNAENDNRKRAVVRHMELNAENDTRKIEVVRQILSCSIAYLSSSSCLPANLPMTSQRDLVESSCGGC